MTVYNPDKPAYQTNAGVPEFLVRTHPCVHQVTVPTPNADEQMRLIEMQRGQDLMFYGIIIATACTIGHFASTTTTNPIARVVSRFLEWGIVLGVSSIAIGLVYKKITQYENWIIFVLIVIGGGALLYWKRDWSISHLLNKKGKSNGNP